MHRVCIEKATGKLIVSDSCGDIHPNPDIDNVEYAAKNLEITKQNAIKAGYAEGDIEVSWKTDEEFAAIMAADTLANQTYQDLRKAAYLEQLGTITDQLDALLKWFKAADVGEGFDIRDKANIHDQIKLDIEKV